MKTVKCLVVAALLGCATVALANNFYLGGSTTGVGVYDHKLGSANCQVIFYSSDTDRNFLAPKDEYISYMAYQDYLSTQWGMGAMTYRQWLTSHPMEDHDEDVDYCRGNSMHTA